jgi:hypothetical protein
MAERLDYPLLLAVDNCVEQLLAGRDWRGELPNDETRPEVAALLEVAERLLKGSDSDETNALRAPGVRLRVWKKLTRAVHRFSARLDVQPGMSPWALRIGAPPPAYPTLATGGAFAAIA